VKPELLKQRLEAYHGNDDQREATLKRIFEQAGCGAERLTEQPVKHLKQPNLICVLPGDSDATILIGAHYDHVAAGDGVVDNWSGASLLRSLFQGLSETHRRYTFIFAAFSGEEKWLVGSQYFVNQLSAEKLGNIRAMICMDTLGLGPTEIRLSRSDKELAGRFATLSQALNLPITAVNVERVGMSDEEPFIKKKVPVIVIHSLTQETLSILHTRRDNYGAMRFDDYFDTYRLISGYLDYLDQTLEEKSAAAK